MLLSLKHISNLISLAWGEVPMLVEPRAHIECVTQSSTHPSSTIVLEKSHKFTCTQNCLDEGRYSTLIIWTLQSIVLSWKDSINKCLISLESFFQLLTNFAYILIYTCFNLKGLTWLSKWKWGKSPAFYEQFIKVIAKFHRKPIFIPIY